MPAGCCTTMPPMPELDAAEALLELRCAPLYGTPNRQPNVEIKKEAESAAALFLSRLIGPNVSQHSLPSIVPPCKNNAIVSQGGSGVNRMVRGKECLEVNSVRSYRQPLPSAYNFYSGPQKDSSSQIKAAQRWWNDTRELTESMAKKIKKETIKSKCERGTQTEIEYQLPQIAQMESVINNLYGKIKILESQLEIKQRIPSWQRDPPTPTNQHSNSSFRDRWNCKRNNKKERSLNRTYDIYSPNENNVKTHELMTGTDTDDSDYTFKPSCNTTKRVLCKRNDYVNNNEMLPIGQGNAKIPVRVLKQMDWTSYTNATRKLLTSVFSRRVLATHSLTGKPSPAFPDKPAKKRLNSALVNDIVQTVVERCNVPENVVRTSITTKCADESKMYRSRQKNKTKSKSQKRSQENVPPVTTDDSSDTDISY